MKELTLDWIECSIFLMIACAETTDHYLDEEEITAILEKTKQLDTKFSGEATSVSDEEVKRKFDKIFKYYNAIGENAPQGKMDEKIKVEVLKSAHYLKDQDWFSQSFAESLIADLVAITRADGVLIKKEVRFIYPIAQLWGVESPFD